MSLTGREEFMRDLVKDTVRDLGLDPTNSEAGVLKRAEVLLELVRNGVLRLVIEGSELKARVEGMKHGED